MRIIKKFRFMVSKGAKGYMNERGDEENDAVAAEASVEGLIELEALQQHLD